MRVAFLLTDITRNGGVQTTVKNLINQLPRDWEISIISLVKSNQSDKILNELDRDIKINYLFKQEFNFIKNLFKITKKLREQTNNENFDVIIGNGLFYAIPMSAMKKGIRKIIWSHSSIKSSKRFGLNWFGKYFSYIFMDDIVAISKIDYNILKKNIFAKKIRLHQVYNTTEYQFNNSNKMNAKNILSVGSISYIKGYDRVLEIAPLLFELYPEWTWNICGEGPLLTKFKTTVNKLNLSKNINFIGNVDVLDNYYANSSIFVLPSRSEGFGLVLLEAKMHSIPIITFSCNGVADEIVNDNINGFVIDDDNIDEFFKKIKIMIGNDELRKKFSQHANLNIEKFEIDKIKNAWISIIKG